MKKKLSWLLLVTVVIVSSVAIVSCKKTIENITNSVDNTNAASAKTQSADASLVNPEMEQTDNDVDNVVSTSAKMCGAGNIFTNTTNVLPPDVTVDATTSKQTLTITFNGTLYGGCRKRTGTITVDLNNASRWIDSGAVLHYTFTNFKVVNTCTNKTITINGYRELTNLSGGNFFTLTTFKTLKLTHKIRGNYSLAFTDASGNTDSANWNVARNTTITYSNPTYTVLTSGDTTISGIQQVESYGTTRNGSSYTTAFTTSIMSNTTCGLWKPTAGVVAHKVGLFAFGVQYGVDSTGTQVLSGCAGYYKISWPTVAGTTATAIIPYN